MSDPTAELQAAGISPEAIYWVEDAIDIHVRELFDDYEIQPDDMDAVVEQIQTSLFEHVIEFGTEIETISINGEFEMLTADFEKDNSQAARSNIIFVLGSISTTADCPRAINDLSGAILAENYSQGL